jgi:SpoIID/LytB domain protein
MRYSIAVSILMTAAFLATGRAESAAKPSIRIGLDRYFAGTNRLLLSCGGPFSVIDNSDGKVLAKANAGAVYQIEVGADQSIVIQDVSSPEPPRTIGSAADGVDFHGKRANLLQIANPSADKNAPLKWHLYRGELTIRTTTTPLLPFSEAGGHPDAIALQAINTVDLEQYLYAVLPAEIGASAPMEALKAQACASRTFALKNLGRFSTQGFDIDDTSRSQSYAGYDGETPRCREAVDSTRGQVITYHGELIEARYSTDSGGVTACDTSGECPYLQAVKDAPESGGPEYGCDERFHQWSKTFDQADLAAALAKDPRTAVPSFQSLAIDGYDASGRVTTATVTGAGGATKAVPGPVLRAILGYDVIRSTLFTLTVQADGSYLFNGKGWGHGLGMSQDGAVAMASDPYNKSYVEILRHYYVGVEITQVDKLPSIACGESGDTESDQRG